jgi:hypothetical protein
LRGNLPDELVDELLAGARTEEEIVGPGGLLGRLTKRLVERAMEVELTDHLGCEPHQEPPGGAGNTRNVLRGRGDGAELQVWRIGSVSPVGKDTVPTHCERSSSALPPTDRARGSIWDTVLARTLSALPRRVGRRTSS